MLQCCAGQRLDIMLHMTCLVRRSAVENRLPVVNHLQLLFTFQRPHLSHGFVRVYNFFFVDLIFHTIFLMAQVFIVSFTIVDVTPKDVKMTNVKKDVGERQER